MALHSRKDLEAIMREIRQRRGDARQGFVREMRLLDGDRDEDLGYAARVPAVAALRDGLELDPRVTFLVGENGSGESTLVEALAVACKLNPEGGGWLPNPDSYYMLGHSAATTGVRVASAG